MKNNMKIQDELVYIDLNCQGNTIQTIIDRDDLSKVDFIEGQWYGWKDGKTGNIYAKCSYKGRILLMHRLVCIPEDDLLVHHKDGDTLNNRRKNLQACTIQESNLYKRLYKNSANGIRNVHQKWNKWHATISFKNKKYYLGSFSSQLEAMRELVKFRKEHSLPIDRVPIIM